MKIFFYQKALEQSKSKDKHVHVIREYIEKSLVMFFSKIISGIYPGNGIE